MIETDHGGIVRVILAHQPLALVRLTSFQFDRILFSLVAELVVQLSHVQFDAANH